MPDDNLPPLQPLDYATPQPRKKTWRPAVVVVLLLIAAGLLVAVLMPAARVRSVSTYAKCASNMHQIGLAILLYQQDYGQNYPENLAELIEPEQLTPNVFICPDSSDTPASGATTQAVVADFHKPGHCSYVYLGKGLNDKNVTDDTVVLYEPVTNHSSDGMNVLFGDGHVEWIDKVLAAKLLSAVATGFRPVKLNTSTGVITATQPTTVR